MNSAHPHVSPDSQAGHIFEFRLQSVRGSEKILLAPYDEDTGRQNGQRRNDERS
jgi:hypothetical protein